MRALGQGGWDARGPWLRQGTSVIGVRLPRLASAHGVYNAEAPPPAVTVAVAGVSCGDSVVKAMFDRSSPVPDAMAGRDAGSVRTARSAPCGTRWSTAVLACTLGLFLAALAPLAVAKQPRSKAARCGFLRAQGISDCKSPAGMEVDHIVALVNGGADHPYNMQLLSVAEHRQKTSQEARQRADEKRSKRAAEKRSEQAAGVAPHPVGYMRGNVHMVHPDGRLLVRTEVAGDEHILYLDPVGVALPRRRKRLARTVDWMREEFVGKLVLFRGESRSRKRRSWRVTMRVEAGPRAVTKPVGLIGVEQGFFAVPKSTNTDPERLEPYREVLRLAFHQARENGVGVWAGCAEHKKYLARLRRAERKRKAAVRRQEREARRQARRWKSGSGGDDGGGWGGGSGGSVYVRPYTRSNGTSVRGHFRASRGSKW